MVDVGADLGFFAPGGEDGAGLEELLFSPLFMNMPLEERSGLKKKNKKQKAKTRDGPAAVSSNLDSAARSARSELHSGLSSMDKGKQERAPKSEEASMSDIDFLMSVAFGLGDDVLIDPSLPSSEGSVGSGQQRRNRSQGKKQRQGGGRRKMGSGKRRN
mmetsp:Transcript_35822/g.93372  ORF Transcript_35822/g.93372 Transcript_35822/m.93372 type:complete len:159 (-) Transcript_35822:1996-2472(-)